MGAYDERPYEVGKGKPPKERRFQPGQSGNPRGRRRQPKPETASMQETLAAVMNEKIKVTIDGKVTHVPARQVYLRKLLNDGLSGTPSHRLKVFSSLNQLNAFNLLPEDQQPTAEQREKMISDFISQLADEARRDEELTTTLNNPR
jgi:hypothetical protein